MVALHLPGVQILTVPGQALSGKKFGGFRTENSEIEGLNISEKVATGVVREVPRVFGSRSESSSCTTSKTELPESKENAKRAGCGVYCTETLGKLS